MTLWQNLRYTFRLLGKSPAFTIVAVLSPALGIGANAAIFRLVNALLLRSIPVRQPDRLVQVSLIRLDSIAISSTGSQTAIDAFSYCTLPLFRHVPEPSFPVS